MVRTARFIVQSLQKLNSNEIFTVSVMTMTAPIAASNIVKCGTYRGGVNEEANI